MRTSNQDSVGSVIVMGVALAGLIGWVMNIIKLVANTGDIDQIARLAGVIIAPIGAIMGWF